MWNRIKTFLCDSNHPYHIAGGALQILVMIIMGYIFNLNSCATLSIGTVMIFFTMVCVELKDMQCGNKFDWSDILAGEVVLILCWIIAGINEIFMWIF